MVSLILAWILIYLCVMRGIKSSGKVMYATATFPYVVTTIFLVRSITLDGATEGLWHMINPDVSSNFTLRIWPAIAMIMQESTGAFTCSSNGIERRK